MASTPALVTGRVDGRGHFVSEVIGGLVALHLPRTVLMLAPATGEETPLWGHLILQGPEKEGLLEGRQPHERDPRAWSGLCMCPGPSCQAAPSPSYSGRSDWEMRKDIHL